MTEVTASVAVAPRHRWGTEARRVPWWRIPLYPVVFLDALILLSWGNAGLHVWLLPRPLAVATAGVLLVALTLAAVLRDRDRAGLIAALIALIALTSDDRAALLLALVALAVLIEGLVHRGRPAPVARLATKVMSGVALIVLVAVAIDLTQSGAWQATIADLGAPALPAHGTAATDHPDIWIFLLDAYPGDRAAARASAFDADSFPNALERRGFDVVRDAHSNYLLTPLTLASMFSMRHLDDIPALDPPYPSRTDDFRRLSEILAAPPAFAIARAAGYDVTVIDGGYGHARLGGADRVVEQPGPQELEGVLIRSTRVEAAIEAVASGTMAAAARSRIDGTFASSLAVAPTGSRPRLVFVHVPAPHPPWVFEADGGARDPRTVSLSGEPELSDQEATEAGAAQAAHIANETLEAIDIIVDRSPRPPVIVVMSDHGPVIGFSTVRPLESDLDERASSFMGAFTPGHAGLFATSRPTPVNLFGTLFNAYLGMDIERRADSIWAWRGESYIDVVEAPPIEGWAR